VQRIEFYTDYRQFLKDYYEDRKSRSKSFSYRQFCLKAGIRSPSLFLEVVEGRRNLTEASTVQFLKGLGLTENDAQYFTTLVNYNQARDSRSKQRWFEELRGMRRRVQAQLIPFDHHEYYARWYFPVLRELVCRIDWNNDFALLARQIRPTLNSRQVRDGIELLVRLGLLKQEGERWIQPSPALTTGNEVDSLLVRSCNRQFADLAALAIDEVPPSRRDASSMVIGISTDGFRRIKEEIRHFKARIARIAEDDLVADRVYALSIQFVPHSAIGDSA
jgi:uncharacterized protein (TIGR02147 family)